MAKKTDQEMKRYEDNVGRPPVTRFPDDPDWKYGGSKTERDELAQRVGFDDDDVPVVIEGQEELFG